MDKNVQDILGGVLSALPGDQKEKVQNCKSKEDFMSLISSAKGMLPSNLFGGKSDAKADGNPLGGLLQGLGISSQGGGNLLAQAGDLLKGVDWSEIQKFITQFFNKK